VVIMDNKCKTTRLDEDIKRGELIQIFVDGRPIEAYKGETIASALLSAGFWICRTIDSKPMGIYCNMGACHSCVMTVNGVSSVRICKTYVSDGCRVESQHFLGMLKR
jgi:sarcosine oxidase subunit alpha